MRLVFDGVLFGWSRAHSVALADSRRLAHDPEATLGFFVLTDVMLLVRRLAQKS